MLDWLATEPRFDVVNLPYTLLIGLAAPLRAALGVPICCTLQGEDLFLDGLGEPYRRQSLDLIRAQHATSTPSSPVSHYYAAYMPGYLGVPARRCGSCRSASTLDGVSAAQRAARPATRSPSATSRASRRRRACTRSPTPTARCAAQPGVAASRLVAAGYLAPSIRRTSTTSTAKLAAWGLGDEFEYRGELDRAGKFAFLHSLDVLSVPATYDEPKGLFLLEAMASGVPVVQPRRGAFPEILERTGGGLLVEAATRRRSPTACSQLWRDPARARALGAAGAAGVRADYTVGRMAGGGRSGRYASRRDATSH